MSEDHPPQSSDFTSEAAKHTGNFFKDHPKTKVGLIAITGSAIVAGGYSALSPELNGPTPTTTPTAESTPTINFDQALFQDLLDKAKKDGFSDSAVVGNQFKITKEGEGPYEPALVEASKDATFAADPMNVSMLLESSKLIGSVNLGDSFDVLKVDLANNGEKEFIVVKDSEIIHASSNGQIPSPTQSYDLPNVAGDGSSN